MPLYPLKFTPRYVEKMWGGRKLQTILGRTLPGEKPFGESWELYDFPPGVVEDSQDWVSAPVAEGPLAGRTLHQLVQEFGPELYGDISLVGPQRQFPILIKYLDAAQDLSVQVHPDERYAQTHPGAYLKSEAWYVVQANAGSRLLKGLVPGATRQAFEDSIHAGTVDQLIQSLPAKEGQCFYLPSGTVHALGAGIFAAEVQTPSDTTYRVFDFNRIDPATGKQRKLHVQEALDCIDFSGKRAPLTKRSHVAGVFTTVTQLVSCDYFKLEKVRFTEGVEETVPYDEPVVWMMLSGQAEIKVDGVKEPTKLSRGDTLLLPAQMKNPVISTKSDCVWLEVTLPGKAKL